MVDEFYKKVKETREQINNPVIKRPIEPLYFWIVFIVCALGVVLFTLGWYF